MTDRITAALARIEGAPGANEDALLDIDYAAYKNRRQLGYNVLPAALRLLEAVEEFERESGWWDDTDSVRTCGICEEVGEHWTTCPMRAAAEFLALLPAVPEGGA